MDSTFYERLDRLYAEDARKVEDFLRRELVGFEIAGDKPGLVAVHNELGSLYRGQGRYAESAREFQETIDLLESMGLKGKKPHLTALLNRAGTYRLDGRKEQAARDFERVLLLIDTSRGDPDALYIKASAMNNLGLTYKDLGKLELAKKHVRDAMEQIAALSGSRAEVASGQQNLAAICMAQNKYDEADQWLAQAMPYYESDAAKNDPHRANAYATLGFVRGCQDRQEEALAAFDIAGAAMERFFGRTENTAYIWFHAALTAKHLGRPDAVERMRRVRALYESLGSDMAETAATVLETWKDGAP